MAVSPIRIESWSLVYEGDSAPRLRGVIEKHPTLKIGETGSARIVTSPISVISGIEVTTMSGTVYELGLPDPAFTELMAMRHLPVLKDAPLRHVFADEGWLGAHHY